MSEFRIVNEYPHPPAKVWRALTDPALIPLWTSTGKGGRPVGFSTEVGSEFKFLAKPVLGWSGVVECKVLEAIEPLLLRYTWLGGAGDDLTTVTYRLEPYGDGTRFTWEHTGFTGIGGLVICKLLGSVRKKMLAVGLRGVLDNLNEQAKI
jgi:uncharacterized protein YndB with AHSA1/START domain